MKADATFPRTARETMLHSISFDVGDAGIGKGNRTAADMRSLKTARSYQAE